MHLDRGREPTEQISIILALASPIGLHDPRVENGIEPPSRFIPDALCQDGNSRGPEQWKHVNLNAVLRYV